MCNFICFPLFQFLCRLFTAPELRSLEMLVLFETPAGYALFKVLNEGQLQEANIVKDFATLEGAQKV